MKLSTLFARAAAILAPVLLGSIAQADVIYVSARGNGQYTDIQPAIAAAQDGDLLLVRSGTYGGFTFDNRDLWIVADVGAVVKINGTVFVRNVAAGKACLLSGLQITAITNTGVGQPAVKIENNAGHVRLQNCTMKGGNGTYTWYGYAGGEGTVVTNSAKVALTGCSSTGGNGGGIALFVSPGGKGGDGVTTQGSVVAIYDCMLKGGVGGSADYINSTDRAGDGGDGCHVFDYGVLASGSQFQGGIGGSEATIPGSGGAGLRVDNGQAQLIGDTFAGGLGGIGYYGNHGPNGQPQAGAGVFNVFAGAARKLTAAAIAAENKTLQFNLSGEPGDKFWLFQSILPDFVYSPARAGVRLVTLPGLSGFLPNATLPASGTATVVVPLADVGGVDALRRHWQGIIVTAGGQVRLSSTAQVSVLNCSDLLPDCNGDGSCDTCDLLLPGVTDCDSNGVPDSCQGDCNSNGVLDPCDVLNGTSLDQNHNWIPDECEPQTTWHVDASAAPGGNGSAGAPFQALAPAFAAAISGDTILVANGLYVSSANRDLDFGGRNMLVKSVGGAANCTIDTQSMGRAFYVSGGTTLAARIEGFTIKNGKVVYPARYGAGVYIYNSAATIRQCVFLSNDAQEGGGLGMRLSNASIEGCVFMSNKATSGAGAYVSVGADVRFQGCTFLNNQAPTGEAGGAYLSQSTVRMERCSFLSNSAVSGGGAMYTLLGDVRLDQCLLAGNSAGTGGGARTSNSTFYMTSCTVVGNTATSTGAAFYHQESSPGGPRVWRNSVVWNNTQPSGAAIQVAGGVLDVDWCDVQGGQAAFTLASGGSLNWGAGNLSQDPLFVDPDGADNNPLTVNDNDYRLALGSPCLDRGENFSVAPDWFDLDGDGNVFEPVPFDFDGNARFVEIPSAPNLGSGTPPLVDLGAWERP